MDVRFQLYLERVVVENFISMGLINFIPDSIDTGMIGVRINTDLHFVISRLERRKMTLVYHLVSLKSNDQGLPLSSINKIVFTRTILSKEEYEALTGYKILEAHDKLYNRPVIATILYELYCEDNKIIFSGYMTPTTMNAFRQYRSKKLEDLNYIYNMINL
jgi:hypothetical protein